MQLPAMQRMLGREEEYQKPEETEETTISDEQRIGVCTKMRLAGFEEREKGTNIYIS